MLPRKIFRGAGKIPYLLRHVRCELMSETSASQHEPTGFYRSRRGRIPREKRNRVEVNTRSYKHADTISGLGASLVQCNYLPTVLERKNRLSLPDIAEVGSAWCGCRSLEPPSPISSACLTGLVRSCSAMLRLRARRRAHSGIMIRERRGGNRSWKIFLPNTEPATSPSRRYPARVCSLSSFLFLPSPIRTILSFPYFPFLRGCRKMRETVGKKKKMFPIECSPVWSDKP